MPDPQARVGSDSVEVMAAVDQAAAQGGEHV